MVFRYRFGPEVALDEVERTFHLACYACEGLFGAARVRLEVGYLIDDATRACILDAPSEVGESAAQIFTSLLSRELGEDSFCVQRLTDEDAAGGTARPELAGAVS